MHALLAVPREPTAGHWLDLCNRQNVALVWPETMDLAISGRAG